MTADELDDDTRFVPVAHELWGAPIFDARFLSRIVLRYFLSDLMAAQPGRVWELARERARRFT